MLLKIVFSLLFCGVALGAVTNYDGYKVYDIYTHNEIQKSMLVSMAENPDYDFFSLSRSIDVPARVMITPQDQPDFEQLLQKYNFDYAIVNENFGESLAAQQEKNQLQLRQRATTRGLNFDAYYRFDDINAYLDELAVKYPSRVTVKTIGKSYEQRELKTITITNGDGRTDKNVIVLDAGIHAREWVAPAEALYVIKQLAENFAANAHLLRNYDWIVLPVVNPDGYEYTHTNTRMWRKTRKPVTTSCTGTDANRNFDFHWGEVGASSYSCADTYKGQEAFSEPETQHVRDLLLSLTGRGKFYLTLHSYGNYLLYPWGYTSALPETWRDIDEVAQAGADAIKSATGTKYTVGSSTNVLYAAAGGSDDYAFAVAKFPISITMELPAGGTGFDPSTAQMKLFITETWIGIKAMAMKVMDKF